MIGLNITMPTTCLNCPCLSTFLVDDTAFRFCLAAHRSLVIMSKGEIKSFVKWMDFQKPEWCPWIEIKDGEQV